MHSIFEILLPKHTNAPSVEGDDILNFCTFLPEKVILFRRVFQIFLKNFRISKFCNLTLSCIDFLHIHLEILQLQKLNMQQK